MGLRGPILGGRRLPERLRRRRRRRRRQGPEHRLQGERGRNQSLWPRPMNRQQGERGRNQSQWLRPIYRLQRKMVRIQSQRLRLRYLRQTRADAPRPGAQKEPVAQMEEPEVQREMRRRRWGADGETHRRRLRHRRR